MRFAALRAPAIATPRQVQGPSIQRGVSHLPGLARASRWPPASERGPGSSSSPATRSGCFPSGRRETARRAGRRLRRPVRGPRRLGGAAGGGPLPRPAGGGPAGAAGRHRPGTSSSSLTAPSTVCLCGLAPRPRRRPLATRYDISYAPSATLWLRWRTVDGAAPPQRALALADPAPPGDGGTAVERASRCLAEGLMESPAVRPREARVLVRGLGGGSLRSSADASESDLKQADLSRSAASSSRRMPSSTTRSPSVPRWCSPLAARARGRPAAVPRDRRLGPGGPGRDPLDLPKRRGRRPRRRGQHGSRPRLLSRPAPVPWSPRSGGCETTSRRSWRDGSPTSSPWDGA